MCTNNDRILLIRCFGFLHTHVLMFKNWHTELWPSSEISVNMNIYIDHWQLPV